MADVAIMEKHHLVAGLLDMKRELTAKHADLLEQLNQTVKDLNAVSRVIGQCDKNAAYIPVFPPRPYKAYFAQGELLALIADALKAMPEGATSKEITDRIQAKQVLAGRDLPKKLEESIKEALRRMKARDAVVQSRRSNNRVIWLLAKRGARQGDQAAVANLEPRALGEALGNVTALPLRK
jgi:hypothetical protein